MKNRILLVHTRIVNKIWKNSFVYHLIKSIGEYLKDEDEEEEYDDMEDFY